MAKIKTGIVKLDEIFESIEYGGNEKIIGKKDGYTLVRPMNNYDSNYKLYHEDSEIVYLIDTGDVYDTLEEMEENSGNLVWYEMVDMEIGQIIQAAWETTTRKVINGY